jgi:hypothetical protein
MLRSALVAAALTAGLVVTTAPAAEACTIQGCVNGVCNLAHDCRPPILEGCYDVLGAIICL